MNEKNAENQVIYLFVSNGTIYIYIHASDKLSEDIKYFEEKCGVPPRIFCVPLGRSLSWDTNE